MRWSKEQKEKLEGLYQKYNYKVCATMMNLPERKVKNAIDRFGYRKGNPSQFKSGHIPVNKGKKFPGTGTKSNFKKGNIPANKKPVGTITERRCHGKTEKYIKCAEGKWMELKRYIYTTRIGSVPDNMVVAFKEEQGLYVKSNLIVITKKEHIERNANIPKRADSLRKLIRREKVRKSYGLEPLTGIGKRLVKF